MLAFASLLAAAALVAAQDQTIQVGLSTNPPGLASLQFIPNSITAKNGSVVTFVFSGIPGNHSVTQSTFAEPCKSFEGGFDSGWVGIPANTSVLPTWNLTITDDSKPIWFFCKQSVPEPHCNLGMVGVINVKPGPNSLSAFAADAKTAALDAHEGGLAGLGASASALPDLGSGAKLFTTDSATAGPVTVAPASSGSASNSASGASQSGSSGSKTGAALGLTQNLSSVLGLLLGGVVIAATMV
uniref:Extracellular serine-rich protein n=1 Tax=Mycena chlorophos TaxID=658473 RepID=A0ABQ0L151_MYCCL|nr:predicted protein [Mycena chlorophos]